MAEKPSPSVQQRALIYVEDGLPGDAFNSVVALKMMLETPELWPMITQVQTYADYVRLEKFSHDPELAEAVIAASNAYQVGRFDDIIGRMNACVGEGLTEQTQANALEPLFAEMRELIYGK